VNKIGNVHGKFRTFPMEIIASSMDDPSFEVEVHEEKCIFRFNFKEVYWNSRLMTEHKRIVQLIGKIRLKRKRKIEYVGNSETISEKEEHTIVADMFAGVGPFSIPLSSRFFKNIFVHANDLNPKSIFYLKKNSIRNKCDDSRLITYNMDGRTFISHLQEKHISPHYIIMNLPSDAPEFLDAFRGCKFSPIPILFVHCFAPKDHDESATIARCEKALGCSIHKIRDALSVHKVRNVAPNKNMLCITFTLPHEVMSLV